MLIGPTALVISKSFILFDLRLNGNAQQGSCPSNVVMINDRA